MYHHLFYRRHGNLPWFHQHKAEHLSLPSAIKMKKARGRMQPSQKKDRRQTQTERIIGNVIESSFSTSISSRRLLNTASSRWKPNASAIAGRSVAFTRPEGKDRKTNERRWTNNKTNHRDLDQTKRNSLVIQWVLHCFHFQPAWKESSAKQAAGKKTRKWNKQNF